MNLTSSSLMKPERHDGALKLVLAAFLVYWICMLPALFGYARAGTAASRALMLPAVAVMYWIASVKATQLARAFAVLGQLQAPHALRHALVREKLRFTGLSWAFLATGAALQLALPLSHASALCGAALVSAAACLGLLRSLSKARILRIPGAQLLDAAPYLIGIALVLADLNALLERVAALSAPVLALCALAFPLLGLWLDRRWRAALPATRWSAAHLPRGLAEWIAMQARRSTILTPPAARQDHIAGTGSVPAPALRLLLLLAPFLFMTGKPVWSDGQVSLYSAFMLMVSGLMMSGALLVRDVHWRSFLMPGGMRRGRVATSILAATLTVQFNFMLLIAAAYVALAYFRMHLGWDEIAHQLLRSATLPIELAFAASLALVLRGAPSSMRGLGALAAATVVAFLLVLVNKRAALPLHAQLSLPAFVLTLLLASALLMVLANRLWTTKKLFLETGRRAP